MSKTQKEFEADYQEIDCRKCDRTFNLGEQKYYTNECPVCYYE